MRPPFSASAIVTRTGNFRTGRGRIIAIWPLDRGLHVGHVAHGLLAAHEPSAAAKTTALPATIAMFARLFAYMAHMKPSMTMAMAAPITTAI